MNARVTVINDKGRVVIDRIWKNRESFSTMSTRGFLAGSVRLDAKIESNKDLDALEEWIKYARISFCTKK